MIKAGDILAIRGRGWISEGILKATGNTVSHVGLVLDDDPDPIITEALYRVITHPLSVALSNCDAAYIITDLQLTDQQRHELVLRASLFSAQTYNYGAIALQLLDAAFSTRFFTRNLTTSKWPICSYLVSKTYFDIVKLDFSVDPKSCTPNDIFQFAKKSIDFSISRIK